MRLAEASSASVPYSPFSSICCQRCAHAKAFRVPSGCGFMVGAISLPSGATMRLRLPWRWNRMGMHRLTSPLGPDANLKRVLLHVHPLDEELDDAHLLGGEQLVPDRGEVGEQARDLALGDLLLTFALPSVPPSAAQPWPLDRARTGRRSGMSPLLTAFGTTWK